MIVLERPTVLCSVSTLLKLALGFFCKLVLKQVHVNHQIFFFIIYGISSSLMYLSGPIEEVAPEGFQMPSLLALSPSVLCQDFSGVCFCFFASVGSKTKPAL